MVRADFSLLIIMHFQGEGLRNLGDGNLPLN
jgi:hypothetical protein